jgi:hypothetical protein
VAPAATRIGTFSKSARAILDEWRATLRRTVPDPSPFDLMVDRRS